MPVRRESEDGVGSALPRYTPEFKQRAVDLYRQSSTTYAEVARGLGIDPGSLSNWVRRADSAGAAGGAEGANPFELAEENCRLRREAARPEREILLKASAFFASMQL